MSGQRRRSGEAEAQVLAALSGDRHVAGRGENDTVMPGMTPTLTVGVTGLLLTSQG